MKKAIIALLGLAVLGCEKKMPPEAWNWHPKLKETKGDVWKPMSGLPLGNLQGHEPEEHPDGTIVMSNIDALSCFITDQREYTTAEQKLWRHALGYWAPDGKPPYAFAYTALLDTGLKPTMAKKDYCSGYNFGNPDIDISFRIKPLEGPESLGPGCKLYAVQGRAENRKLGMLGGIGVDIPYVVLQGAKKNLYFEVAVPGVLPKPKKDSAQFFEDGPYRTAEGWKQPTLAKLKAAYEASGLDVCSAP